MNEHTSPTPKRTDDSRLVRLAKETVVRFADGGPIHGAGMAYYAMLSIPPITVISLKVMTIFLGVEEARKQLSKAMTDWLGPDGAKALARQIKQTIDEDGSGTLATIIGISILLWTASRLFSEITGALNRMWGVMPEPGAWVVRLRRTILKRLSVVILTTGVAALLIASSMVNRLLTSMLGTDGIVGGLVRTWTQGSIEVGLVAMSFGLLYRALPEVRISWRSAILGGFVTSLGLIMGKWALTTYYATLSSESSAYGAVGAVFATLIWLSYSSQIFLFGASFTRTWAEVYGDGVHPRPGWLRGRMVPLAADVLGTSPPELEQDDDDLGHF